MSIPAGQTFDAFWSLIDRSNPSKSSGIQFPFTVHIASSFAGCGMLNDGPSRWLLLSILGKQGCQNHLCCSSSLRLTEFGARKSSVLIHPKWTLSVLLSAR